MLVFQAVMIGGLLGPYRYGVAVPLTRAGQASEASLLLSR